jgi:hypothetical protein
VGRDTLAPGMPRPTVPVVATIAGNLLFERTVAALGFDDSLMRRVVAEALSTIDARPLDITPAEVGILMPEIERRLLLLAPHERVAPSIGRLRRLLLCWDALP